ncbi:hypothetical protein HYC85_030419 [Camellia sinensis]|uniref:Uncharacterized protein n=1 Tax=Camellia sinensis TaxID=4442 RepID=A0A7J7G3R8_CAMSI|nr:hypothetical protein HYC85_030419 [Camellia sinensis]
MAFLVRIGGGSSGGGDIDGDSDSGGGGSDGNGSDSGSDSDNGSSRVALAIASLVVALVAASLVLALAAPLVALVYYLLMGEEITHVKNITSFTHDWKAKVQIDNFEDTLEVFKSYYISNVVVKSVQEKYRMVPNEWKWTINASTLIQPAESAHTDDNPLAHDFVTFDKFEKNIDKQTEIDILAAVVEVRPPKIVTPLARTTTVQEVIMKKASKQWSFKPKINLANSKFRL